MSNPTSCFVKKKNDNNNNRKAMKWQLFITLFSLIGCTAWNTTIWPLLLWLKAILPGFFPPEPRFRFQNGGCMKSAYRDMFGLLAFSWVWQLIWCFRMFPCVSAWSMETSSCCWLLRDVTGEALLWLVGFFLMWWRSYEVCLEFLRIQVLKFFSEKFDEVFEFFKWSAWW